MAIDILQTQKLIPSCEAALRRNYAVHDWRDIPDREAFLREVGPRIRGIAGQDVDAALIAALPALEIVAGFGVGYDAIDTKAAKAGGIRVTNTPDVLNDAVAELALGLMIALARRIPQADRHVREGRWPQGNFPLQSELGGRTLGIVGLGRIGKEIAQRAQAMKMRVVYFGRNRQARQPFVYYQDLVAMARDADWLLVIAPGGQATRKLISRQVLEALGPQGMLVNMARGTLVDEAALVEMLASGALGGAALDVFENEPQVPEALLGLDNVVLSPHQGSGTVETRDAMGALLVGNLDAHFAGEPLLSAVV